MLETDCIFLQIMAFGFIFVSFTVSLRYHLSSNGVVTSPPFCTLISSHGYLGLQDYCQTVFSYLTCGHPLILLFMGIRPPLPIGVTPVIQGHLLILVNWLVERNPGHD